MKLALAFLLLPVAAWSADVPVSWTVPTANVSGSPLEKCPTQTSTADCLIGYRAYRGLSPTALTETVTINDRNALGYTWTNLASGTHYFAVTALKGSGQESAYSGIGNRVVPPEQPNPPGNFTVAPVSTGSPTAYKMRTAVNGFTFVAIGTVPAGTPCMDQQAGEYRLVDRDSVRMASRFDPKPEITFARCS